jgi:hypothetical protein
MRPAPRKRVRHYSRVGHVHFPIYDSTYENLAEISPKDAGVLVVRLLVEDQTPEKRWPVADGPQSAPDDFMVGCDRMAVSDAYAYLGEPRRIVDNILLGAIDWPGVRRLPLLDDTAQPDPNAVEFFRATKEHLDESARSRYDKLAMQDGCRALIVTFLDRKKETVDLMMEEAQRLQLLVTMIPKVQRSPILCGPCMGDNKTTVKPLMSARRLGWRKVGQKGQDWLCPIHAEHREEAEDA